MSLPDRFERNANTVLNPQSRCQDVLGILTLLMAHVASAASSKRILERRAIVQNLCPKIVLLIALLLLSPNAKAQEIEFGPGLRSIDFARIFDRRAEARAHIWDDFYDHGIRKIVISQALVSPYAPDQSKRNNGTFLSDADLGNLRDTLNRGVMTEDDFHVTYVGGYGIGPPICDLPKTTIERGRDAANWEYENIVRRLLDNKVPIRALDVDGPFLRLIANSKKAFGCAKTFPKGGFPEAEAAQITLAYMKQLRDLINAHGTNKSAGIEVNMFLLINLPNWKVGDEPALQWAGQTGDLITGVLSEFKNLLETDNDNPLKLGGVVIDYPYNHAKGNPVAFKSKTEQLLKILKDFPNTRAKLTFITNTDYTLNPNQKNPKYRGYEGTVKCVWLDHRNISGASVPYLPYKNSKGQFMPNKCISQQNSADERYWDESAKFASNILSGAWRNRSVLRSDVSALRFMSWHEMPASTLSTMNRTLRYKLYGR